MGGKLTLPATLTVLVLASCSLQDSTGNPPDAGDAPLDTPDETTDCLIEWMGREYERSEFILCDGLDPCPPGDIDLACPRTIPCPGTPCDSDAPPGYCEYCASFMDWYFAVAVCQWSDYWEITSSHCDDFGWCTPDDCDDGDPCTSDRCEDGYYCVNEPIDADKDGHAAAEVDGVECDGDDCDDFDPEVHPGTEEIPGDGIDNDCDEETGP